MLIRGGLIEESLSQGGGAHSRGGAQLKIYYQGGGGRSFEGGGSFGRGALFRGNTVFQIILRISL